MGDNVIGIKDVIKAEQDAGVMNPMPSSLLKTEQECKDYIKWLEEEDSQVDREGIDKNQGG